MIDKMLYVNSNKVVVYFTNRQPLEITTDNGMAFALYLWLQGEAHSNAINDIKNAKLYSYPTKEDTCIISMQVYKKVS